MNIFYIPITNKIALKNYENTIKNRVNFENEDICNLTNNCGVWGFNNKERNKSLYNIIKKGDIIFFRINDNDNYQCFDGFGRVSQKEISGDLAYFFWKDNLYENIIYFDKVIIFNEPFRLSKKRKALTNLTFGKMWHNAYEMFRKWNLKEDDPDVKKEEDLIDYFLTFSHKDIYNQKSNANDFSINEENLKLVNETEKELIVKARIGQSELRDKLIREKKKCELCGINKKELLIASHIKPWSISNEEERLDLNNVLLFCSMHDTLFDKGFITFDDEGKIIISNELDQINRVFSNINLEMKISINEEKKKYLKYHRENIFKK